MAAKPLPGCGASLFREPLSAISFEPPKDEKKEGDKKDDDKKTTDAKDSDKKDADKKDAASQTADAKKDEKKDQKKDEKKEEKKLKEQEKDVQEIAVALEFPRKNAKRHDRAARCDVVTMKGDEVLKNADIVIENNRIKSVGAKGSVPASAKVFDVAGKTIVPGFVDTHAHWTEIRRGILDTQNWSFLANSRTVSPPVSTCRLVPTTCLRTRISWIAAIFSASAPSRPGPAFFPTTTSSLPRK